MTEEKELTEKSSDLTEGPITKKLMRFFLPIAAGMLFQQLYNAVDALVVGKYVGTAALAAVGGTPAILISLIIGFCASLAEGAAVVIAQLYGAKRQESVTVAVKTSMLFCILLGAFVGGVVILASPWLLTVLKTPADTFADALLYQRIYFSAGIFLMVFNMGSGILRAVGDSRFPFICLFISCGLNIVLDILLVAVWGFGVAGAALATVAAQAVSAVFVTVKLFKTKGAGRLRLRGVGFGVHLLGRMMRVGVPSGLQSSVYGFANMILQIGINSLGTTVVASWSMSGKIDGIFWSISNAFGVAITAFIGQNFGALRFSRVKESARKGFGLLFGMTVFVSGGILLSGRFLLHVLTNDATVVETTWYIMLHFVPLYILWSVIEVFSGVLRGIGDVGIPFLIQSVGICVFRIIWIFTAFRSNHTLSTMCLCYPISWAITDVAILIYYRYRKNHLTSQGKSEMIFAD